MKIYSSKSVEITAGADTETSVCAFSFDESRLARVRCVAMQIESVRLTNFLSYKSANLNLGRLTALIGPNASGKSNAVSAIRLLREIPGYGLQTALSRRGGFDQLRHRSRGRPFDPSLSMRWRETPVSQPSIYELKLGSISGKRYRVKSERWHVDDGGGSGHEVIHSKGRLTAYTIDDEGKRRVADEPLPEVLEGASALTSAFRFGGMQVWQALNSLQTIDINPALVGGLQDPVSGYALEPDGSNSASVFEALPLDRRGVLTDLLASIVPGISKIEPRHVADKLTLTFVQTVQDQPRVFSAKQMSDGTLRAFGILLGLVQPIMPRLLVIEEPETAIHLGALRTLVGIMEDFAGDTQILMTTHSAEVIDVMDLEDLRVVWQDDGESHIAGVAEHTKEIVREGLITPGELLRSDALDPEWNDATR